VHGIYIDAYRAYWRESTFTITTSWSGTSYYRRQDQSSAKKLRKQVATVKSGDYANTTRLVIAIDGRTTKLNFRLEWASPQPRTSTVALGGDSGSGGPRPFLVMGTEQIFEDAVVQKNGVFDAKEALIGCLERLTNRLGPFEVMRWSVKIGGISA